MQKKILLITYHFPPSAASGTFRLLGFARHLPRHGWQPLVVAPPMLPWEPIDPALLKDVPPSTVIREVRYPAHAPKLLRAAAQYAIWLPRAWSACKQMVAEHRPDVVLTSGPPHCVHALGHYLKRRTGLPWVADFRDPWISNETSRTLTWRQRWALRWERGVFENADLVLANAPNACTLYQRHYPAQREKIVTLTNGFDPQPVSHLVERKTEGNVELLHAGEIYAGRNPTPLFEALATLKAGGNPVKFRLLGRCESSEVHAQIRERGWTDFVVYEGQRDYQDALQAMQAADILVLFDSPGRRVGVPAKLYEYLGAGRPILALAEGDGDTAAILRESGVLHRVVAPTDAAGIHRAVAELVAARVSAPSLHSTRVAQFTREKLAGVLAGRLNTLVGVPNLTALRVQVGSGQSVPTFQEAER